MSRPMDIRDWRAHERAIKELEASKAALKRHYEHMIEHRAELQEHIATVDEQINMVGPAMEAIDAQLAGYRGRAS